MSNIDLHAAPFFLADADIAWVEETIAGMTLEEKVGQLFTLVSIFGTEEELTETFRVMKPGGIMYRPMPAAQAVRCTQLLHGFSRIPMLIAANLEKGANGVATEGSLLGAPLEIAATDDVRHAERLGTLCGREGGAVGVNWAFAPIVDIDYNFRNPITNTRTFGSNPARVAAMGKAYVEAVQQCGLAASVKHFPGDGCDERDQHLVTSINDLSCEEWDSTYGSVYRACIEAGAKTVMVGHIMQPAWSRRLRPGIRDEDMLPASLSEELMNGLLREHLGFNGLICTDATTMAGFTIPIPRRLAVPASINAGADMFLFTKNMQEDYGYMLDAAKSGYLSAERLHDALTRILGLKASLGLHRSWPMPEVSTAQEIIGCEEHLRWSQACAADAITLVKEEKGVLPLSPKKYPRVLFCPIESEKGVEYSVKVGACARIREMLEAEGFRCTTLVPENQFEGQVSPSTAITEAYDLIVYAANLATKSNQTTVRIEWQQPMGANCPHFSASVPTVFISVENPYHLLDVPRIKTFINAYSSHDAVLAELMDKLMGRSPFRGKNPVDPFCGKWDTHL